MNISNDKELIKLIKVLRKNGVKSFKLGGIELELYQHAPATKQTKIEKDVVIEEQPSEEELLFWSSTPMAGVS